MVNTPLFSMVCMSPVNSQLWQAKPSHDIQIGSFRLRQAHQFSMHRCYFSRVLVLTCFACRHEKFDALVLNCTVQWTLFSFLFFTLLIHSNFDLTGCHVPANRRSAKYGTGAAGSHHLHCLGLNSECFQCFLHSVPVLTEFPPLCRIRCN